MKKNILTIAGSDPLAGGGFQADLRTFQDFGIFGISSVTCVGMVDDKENFKLIDIDEQILKTQLSTVNHYAPIDGIKIGLIHNIKSLPIVQEFLSMHKNIPIILDPVLAFKETDQTIDIEYMEQLIQQLFPLATIITPNLVETALLTGKIEITSIEEMKEAACNLFRLGAQKMIIKGGERLPGEAAVDLYYDGEQFVLFENEKLSLTTVNGAGCTFASAIASNLVLGREMLQGIKQSKHYVFQSIANGFEMKDGSGNVWSGGCPVLNEE